MSKTNRFKSEKESRFRAKEDLSKKGSIDEPIVELMRTVNSCDSYYTTSSCSGRIIIIGSDDQNNENPKKGTKWLYVSHDFATIEDIMTAIESNESQMSATFKFEPFIAHVCCDGLTSAKSLLNCAISCGFRNSGLSISKSDRIILAVRSTHSLEIPIICENQLIVDRNYIEFIIKIANKKLKQNFERINKFYLTIKSLCDNSSNV